MRLSSDSDVISFMRTRLAGQVKRSTAVMGLDVAIGALHADSDRRDSLVYDLIEPLRPVLDSRLLGWAKGVKWRRTDFKVSVKGVVSLEDNLKRMVAAKSGGLGAEVDEVVRWYVKQLLLLNS